MFLFEQLLKIFILYSFVNQFIRLFSHTFQFGLRHAAEYPALLDQVI